MELLINAEKNDVIYVKLFRKGYEDNHCKTCAIMKMQRHKDLQIYPSKPYLHSEEVMCPLGFAERERDAGHRVLEELGHAVAHPLEDVVAPLGA